MNLRHASLLTSVALFGSVASAADLLVPQQFATIQAAVDAAAAGDRVVIDQGVYDETVFAFGKTDLVLKGKKGAIVAPSTDGEGLRFQLCQQLELRGLTVRGSSESGIILGDCSDVLVRKCVTRDTGAAGIAALDTDGLALVQNVLIDAANNGIFVTGDDVEIDGNRIEGAGQGGMKLSGANYTITENRISETQNAGIEATAVGLLIADNRLIDTSGISAITPSPVENAVDMTVLDNVVKKTSTVGIHVLSGLAILQGNKIKGATVGGIALELGTDGSFVAKNAIKGTIEVGLLLASSNNLVFKNKVKKSGEADVLDLGAENVFLSNSFGSFGD